MSSCREKVPKLLGVSAIAAVVRGIQVGHGLARGERAHAPWPRISRQRRLLQAAAEGGAHGAGAGRGGRLRRATLSATSGRRTRDSGLGLVHVCIRAACKGTHSKVCNFNGRIVWAWCMIHTGRNALICGPLGGACRGIYMAGMSWRRGGTWKAGLAVGVISASGAGFCGRLGVTKAAAGSFGSRSSLVSAAGQGYLVSKAP